MWVAPCFRFYTHHNMLRKLHPVYFSHSPISGRSSPIGVSSFTAVQHFAERMCRLPADLLLACEVVAAISNDRGAASDNLS